MENIPYCGIPPIPAEIWTQWNFDPPLIIVLLILGLLWTIGSRSGADDVKRGYVINITFFGSNILLWLAFVSPLCNLTMALFSARVAQHLMLALIAAPLLAFARPIHAIGRSLGCKMPNLKVGLAWTPLSAVAFAALFWFWHLPFGYALSLQSDLAYWTMHLSVLGSAILLWHGLFNAAAPARPAAVLAALLTGAQMTILSVLIVFSTNLWHDWHSTTTFAWGLIPMEDQILGGTIMWVFGAAIFLSALIGVAARWITSDEYGLTTAAAKIASEHTTN